MCDKVLLGAAITAILAATAPARAQLPPDTLIGGQVLGAFQNNNGAWCYVAQGASAFQRNGTNSLAVISFPELIYFDGAYHPLNGQARLTFTTATSGTIKFKFWGASGPITNPNFDSYTEGFNGQQYIVTFNIDFPNSCTLPIYAGYETP